MADILLFTIDFYKIGEMTDFSIDLIENNQLHALAVHPNDNSEYNFHHKSGILKRKYNKNWTSSAIEFDYASEVKNELMRPQKIKAKDFHFEEVEFNPGKIIRENQYLLDFLAQLDVFYWQVIFRVRSQERLIVKNKADCQKKQFQHTSVLVRLKKDRLADYIEIGEGNTKGEKFNQNGICQRIKDILRNHDRCRPVIFSDKTPLVLGSGDGAIIFHEILGHSIEADYIYQGISPISLQDIGKRIISRNVSLWAYDEKDAFFDENGFDDEGETDKPKVLVEGGILRNLISDFFYKILLNLKKSGHSRVEDFTRIPLPRMYGIYLQPGEYSPEELVESTDRGVYAREFGEGKVYFNKNLFYFNIKDACLIEKGKITSPLGNIIVRGDIFEVLNSVDMVANDFCYDKGVSYCFKNGQTVNVRVGQPSVKINNLVVTKEYND